MRSRQARRRRGRPPPRRGRSRAASRASPERSSPVGWDNAIAVRPGGCGAAVLPAIGWESSRIPVCEEVENPVLQAEGDWYPDACGKKRRPVLSFTALRGSGKVSGCLVSGDANSVPPSIGLSATRASDELPNASPTVEPLGLVIAPRQVLWLPTPRSSLSGGRPGGT